MSWVGSDCLKGIKSVWVGALMFLTLDLCINFWPINSITLDKNEMPCGVQKPGLEAWQFFGKKASANIDFHK